ncbi:MAG: acyltransferase [bacterium]|jgi:peptidoglycan/LPS O-acetylase OafA/YrhL|nr:acyltransferase [bacterium]
MDAHADAIRTVQRRHVAQIDVLRVVTMFAVIGVHTIMFTQPVDGIGSNGLLVLLHVSRLVFFFVTAFVLFYSYGERDVSVLRFWRRRFPAILVPYLAWTVIYWQLNRAFPWGGYPDSWPQALGQLGQDLGLGWFHLYFLLVTMQLYVAFPLVSWLIRRTRGRHVQLLLASAAVQVAWTTAMQYAWAWLPGPVHALFQSAQVGLWSYQFFVLVGALAAVHLHEVREWIRAHSRLAPGLAVGSLVAGEGVYLLNVRLGQQPASAQGVFQPATILLFAGVVLSLWLLAERLLRDRGAHGSFQRGLRWAGETSFGIYLSHMVVLQLVLLDPVRQALGLDGLPLVQTGIATWLVAATGTTALAVALRYTELSRLLTGRARLPLPRRSGPAAVPESQPARRAA